MISYSRFTVTATMASTIGPRCLSLHEHHQLTLLVELHPHCGDKLLEIRLEIVLQRGERAKNPFTTARPFSGTNYLEIVRGYCCSSKRVNVPGMIACASRRKQKRHPSIHRCYHTLCWHASCLLLTKIDKKTTHTAADKLVPAPGRRKEKTPPNIGATKKSQETQTTSYSPRLQPKIVTAPPLTPPNLTLLCFSPCQHDGRKTRTQPHPS